MVSRTRCESVGNGNPYTLFLRENGCNLSGEKFNNINEDKNDLEVPLLGIYSMVVPGKSLPKHTFWGREGIPSSTLWCFLPCWRNFHHHETVAFLCSLIHSSQEEVEWHIWFVSLEGETNLCISAPPFLPSLGSCLPAGSIHSTRPSML